MRLTRIFSMLVMTSCIVGSLAINCFAQPGGRGPGGQGGGMRGMGGGMGGGLAGLLMIPEVRTELKIDEEQVKELDALSKEMREEMQKNFTPGQPPDMKKMRDAMTAMATKVEAKLEETLDPTQLERLVGLSLQRDGVGALRSKLVAAKLEFNDEQQAKMQAVDNEMQEKMAEMFSGGFSPENREKMQSLREESTKKIEGLLTDKQKADMETLKGPAFKFPERGPGGPGGGPGGGGPGGRGGRGGRPGGNAGA